MSSSEDCFFKFSEVTLGPSAIRLLIETWSTESNMQQSADHSPGVRLNIQDGYNKEWLFDL